jgi:hypothetical protein
MKEASKKTVSIKKELLILVVCLIAAIGLNIYAVSKYNTDWSELFGQMHIIGLIGLVIYGMVVFFRIVAWLLIRLIIKK